MIQKILKFLLPLAFGIGLILFMMSNIEIDAVMAVIRRGINWWWVMASCVLATLSHVARGIRWRMQLETVGARPSVHEMTVSVFGNYGMNLVFPRLGEIWRCNYISSITGLPFTTTVGTMISERIADMLLMGLIALLAFLLQSHVFIDFFAANGGAGEGIVHLITSPWPYLCLLLMALGVWLGRRYLRHWSPYRYVAGLIANLWKGATSLLDLPHFGPYILWSFILWGLYFVNTWVQFYFFDFTSHLGILAALSVFTMGSLSQLAPVQGGLGAWHFMVIFSLCCYGIGETEAFSFALVSWFLEQGFVLILGLYAMIVTMLTKRSKKQ